ncbi:haloacid dehalogenase-like hydrolase [Candidatus Cytomitobacter primus]|uniref:Haloacid dehalogenase-like hydrolase n=1 Tax=Candidatus Cytomitobacter primus TaxID=2066024 RepID=A0A5C0UFB2_9PROT|nr:haloacid dehalogenase-like hydrolase [Candidatus Cytomitobacter primus]QEK38748.1 hypothetical protein FZC34_02420 [Candidatus Cytomitobacter primus]
MISLMIDYSYIFVDLDGTLVKQNVGFELFKALIFKCPFVALKVQLNFLMNRKMLNIDILNKYAMYLNFAKLDFHAELVNFIKCEKKRGKKIILATGSPIKIAERLNIYLNNLFDGVIGSHGDLRCVSEKKLIEINKYINKRSYVQNIEHDDLSKSYNVQFMYIGNSNQDITVWEGAGLCAVVGDNDFKSRMRLHNIVFDIEFAPFPY